MEARQPGECTLYSWERGEEGETPFSLKKKKKTGKTGDKEGKQTIIILGGAELEEYLTQRDVRTTDEETDI